MGAGGATLVLSLLTTKGSSLSVSALSDDSESSNSEGASTVRFFKVRPEYENEREGGLLIGSGLDTVVCCDDCRAATEAASAGRVGTGANTLGTLGGVDDESEALVRVSRLVELYLRLVEAPVAARAAMASAAVVEDIVTARRGRVTTS